MNIKYYGGYNKCKSAYFIYVEYTQKNKRQRSVETILLIDKKRYENNPEEFCRNVLKLDDAKILISKIKINALLSINGFRAHITGRSNNSLLLANANQFMISPEDYDYLTSVAIFNTYYCGYKDQNKNDTADSNENALALKEIILQI